MVITVRTNQSQLVKISVVGEVASPVFRRSPYRISHDGQPLVYPGVGGITYNIRVGDLATGWMADHVEPGVSLENKEKEDRFPHGPNYALNVLSCVGNEATIITGDQKGAKGVVTGKHGGIEHVMIDFTEEIIRLKSHLTQLKACLEEGGAVAKRLTYLLQEVHRTELHCFDDCFARSRCRNHDDRQSSVAFTNSFERFQSGRVGQHHVENHDIGTPFACNLQTLGRRSCLE